MTQAPKDPKQQQLLLYEGTWTHTPTIIDLTGNVVGNLPGIPYQLLENNTKLLFGGTLYEKSN